MRYQNRNSEFHLTPDQIRDLWRAAEWPRNSAIVGLLAYTGMRRAELQGISVDDLDLVHRRVLIRRGKGSKQRLAFLPEQLVPVLTEQRQRAGSSFLFPGRQGRPLTLRTINNVVAASGRHAGIENPNPRYANVAPHLLRHSFARNWKRAGGSLESLKRILGHSSIRTTMDLYGTESIAEVEVNYRALIAAIVQP